MIDGGTRVAGIIGWPVEHSLSPAMHNAAFAALDLNWTYVAFPVPPERAEQAIAGLAAAGCAGLNATIPHKLAALRAASSASEAAVAIGAANTLVPDGDGGFRADNTDAAGFLRALDEQAPLQLAGADALVLGAGGAARAVVHALRLRGARVRVANRTAARAAELGDPVPFAPEALDLVAGQSALVVNATSLGLRGDGPPPELPLAGLGRGQVVADVVYRPGGTPWLAAAAARGARTVDGLGMLLHQGAAAFAQWTGREPPLDAMRAALPGEGSGPGG
jgi:shikimate dehydrogenase